MSVHDDRINATDALSLGVLLSLTLLVGLVRLPVTATALLLLAIFAKLTGLILLLAYMAPRSRFWRVLHDFGPAVVILGIFNSLGPLIDAFQPARWDLTFARLDVRLFGELAATWRNLLGHPTWLTDLAYVSYFAYYATPVVLAVVLYRARPHCEFQQFVFTVVCTFYASYVGYFLFPTLGPRVPFEAEAPVIGGGALSAAARAFIHFAERTQTDAFPSGHTAIALVSLAYAWKTSPRLGAIVTPVVASIIFSTVYLHYHYVVDIVAGVALAAVCLWIGPRLEPQCEPRALWRRVAFRLGML